jgi:cytochrome P450
MAILCWYPKVQENIYKEISEYKKKKSSLPSFDDRHHLPYLNSVLSECLRWKPTNAAGFPHETTADSK